MLSEVTAIILAGGLGTRLRSVVADRPKVLALVNGKPFLAYLLEQIAVAGMENVVLCVGYQGEKIQTAFGREYAGMRLTYSQETTPLGTGGALRLALPLIESKSFIAMNGDSFCEANLTDLWEWSQARLANVTLALTLKPDTARYGRVSLSADQSINDFEEKGNATTGEGWINAGIYVIDSEIARDIPLGRVVSLEREIFPSWVGRRLYGYQNHSRFLDIGTPESYAQADTFFANERKK